MFAQPSVGLHCNHLPVAVLPLGDPRLTKFGEFGRDRRIHLCGEIEEGARRVIAPLCSRSGDEHLVRSDVQRRRQVELDPVTFSGSVETGVDCSIVQFAAAPRANENRHRRRSAIVNDEPVPAVSRSTDEGVRAVKSVRVLRADTLKIRLHPSTAVVTHPRSVTVVVARSRHADRVRATWMMVVA